MNFEHLIAAVIHDLKNQLQTLVDYEEQAISYIPEQYHRHLMPILQRTNRLKNDTLQMMTLFRLEQNQQFPMDDAWPKDTVNEAVSMSQQQFPSINFVNNINEDCQGFYNETLIHLALVTLITNSAQAGATEVIFNATVDDEGGLTIEVCDNGHGFSEAVLEGKKQTTKIEGSGLGLFFVRLIAEHHQRGDTKGSISYGNRLKNTGALVEIFIP